MFPLHYLSIRELMPRMYFGGDDPPKYLTAQVGPSTDVPAMLSALEVVAAGTGICGFIEDEQAFYSPLDTEHVFLDGSREFVFICHYHPEGRVFPDPTGMLRFLQEPSRKMLFISPSGAILIEKSQETLELCLSLDLLWATPEIQEKVQELDASSGFDSMLPLLMRAHESHRGCEPSEMWDSWDTFGLRLMRERLALRVQEFSRLTQKDRPSCPSAGPGAPGSPRSA